MFTGKQRAYLRSLSQTMDAIFQIGKGGITEEMCQQIANCLEARELIKLRVLDNSGYTARDAAEEIAAEVGAEVLAVQDGVVESIYRDDILTGTEITVDHGDGVKTVYRFVTANEDLTVGMAVKRGDCIATVAEATGEEYKDGAHLHFEVRKSGATMDPAVYLTFEEK